MSTNEVQKTISEFFAPYKYRYDMHVHSNPGSECSEVPVRDVVDRYHRKGYDGFVITNHLYNWEHRSETPEKYIEEQYMTDYRIAHERAKDYGMNVIFGAEVHYDGWDHLIYGLDFETAVKAAVAMRGTEAEFYKACKNDKNLILRAHPFRDDMPAWDENAVDGIELLNGAPGINSANSFAIRYAVNHPDKVYTVGSDYHILNYDGLAAVCFKENPANPYELAELLKKRDYVFEVSGSYLVPPGMKCGGAE